MPTSATETRIDAFLGRYTPEIEAQLRDARSRLRALFPRGFELVFDNYNALVFGFGATDRSRDAFVSVVGYPKWTTLFFLRGIDLHDPHGLLQGQGKQVRSIRLKTAADIHTPEIAALISEAMQKQSEALLAAPPLSTIIKLAVTAQRPRRPATAKPAARKRSVRKQ